jgi:hypothetical protein
MISAAGRVPTNAFRLLSRLNARPTLLVSRAYATAPPANLNEGERVIWTKLQDKFTPSDLTVMDVSGTFHILIGSILCLLYSRGVR